MRDLLPLESTQAGKNIMACLDGFSYSLCVLKVLPYYRLYCALGMFIVFTVQIQLILRYIRS